MTQDEPVMDGSTEAGDTEKLAGILEQLGADVRLRPLEDGERLLRQRLVEADIPLDDSEISRLVRSLAT